MLRVVVVAVLRLHLRARLVHVLCHLLWVRKFSIFNDEAFVVSYGFLRYRAGKLNNFCVA